MLVSNFANYLICHGQEPCASAALDGSDELALGGDVAEPVQQVGPENQGQINWLNPCKVQVNWFNHLIKVKFFWQSHY